MKKGIRIFLMIVVVVLVFAGVQCYYVVLY